MQGRMGILTARAEAAGVPSASPRLAAGRHRPGDRLHGADGRGHGARGPTSCTGVPDRLGATAGCLTIREREEILVGIRAGESLSVIARGLGRAPSTITREVARQRRPGRLLGLARPSASP